MPERILEILRQAQDDRVFWGIVGAFHCTALWRSFPAQTKTVSKLLQDDHGRKKEESVERIEVHRFTYDYRSIVNGFL